eukprot:scaffold26750_cov21-Tisochrysis_lutea.AAC.1
MKGGGRVKAEEGVDKEVETNALRCTQRMQGREAMQNCPALCIGYAVFMRVPGPRSCALCMCVASMCVRVRKCVRGTL